MCILLKYSLLTKKFTAKLGKNLSKYGRLSNRNAGILFKTFKF